MFEDVGETTAETPRAGSTCKHRQLCLDCSYKYRRPRKAELSGFSWGKLVKKVFPRYSPDFRGGAGREGLVLVSGTERIEVWTPLLGIWTYPSSSSMSQSHDLC
jgi:hypothetical protein